jgi:hypothetical protein
VSQLEQLSIRSPAGAAAVISEPAGAAAVISEPGGEAADQESSWSSCCHK